MKKNMEIIVASFDGYSDIWGSFVKIFRKNWPDCPYNIRMVSNRLDCDGMDTIKTGAEIDWNTRVLKALESVNEEYVLLLLEDYLIGKRVDSSRIEEMMKLVNEKNMNYFRLTNFPKSRFTSYDDEYTCLYKDEEYAINLQAAIWKVSYLKKMLHKYPGNAWQFEVGLLSETIKSDHVPLEGCYTMLEDPLYIVNGVLKGQWFPSAIRYFAKQGVTIDTASRGSLTKGQVIKYEIVQLLKDSISYKTRKRLKKVAKKFGVKFVSEY